MRNTSKTSRKQVFTRKAFIRAKFHCLYQVNENPNLSATDSAVYLQISKHVNEADRGGRAYPSYKTIGRPIGKSEATVIRSIRRLVAEGHLKVIWGRRGRGHPNQYWLVVKPSSMQVSVSDRKQTKKDLKPSPVKENNKLLLKKKLGENSASRFFNLERAADAALDLKEEAFRKKEEKKGANSTFSQQPAVPDQDRDNNFCTNLKTAVPDQGAIVTLKTEVTAGDLCSSPDDQGDNKNICITLKTVDNKNVCINTPDFETLQAIWCRPWPDDELADRLAFERAIAGGGDIGEILEAAKCWVAAADAPRFLPKLDRWLNARGWLKVPPQRRQRTGGHRRLTHAEVFAGVLAEANRPKITYRDLFPEVA
jgi:hypothetical protein